MTPAVARRLAELHEQLAAAYREAAGDAAPAPAPATKRTRRRRTVTPRPAADLRPEDVQRWRQETRRRGIRT